jgi:tRNA pseudouridine32 synthase/23S rRNA pseudouridine746 synthase
MTQCTCERSFKLHNYCCQQEQQHKCQKTIIYVSLVLLVIPWFPIPWSMGLALVSTPRPSRHKVDRLCPGSHPSEAFLPPNMEILCNTVEWGERSQMLPVQRYYARRSINRPNDDDYDDNNEDLRNASAMNDANGMPENLQSIFDNPTQFNLSKSTLHYLRRYYGINTVNGTTTTMASSKNPPTIQTTPAAAITPSQEDAFWKKILAEHRASQPIPRSALEILYCDADICVVNKPSGVLSVPGPRRNPSLANLVYDTIQPPSIEIDQTVVHRLDMATSGILIYALSVEALSKLHVAFKERNVQKTYVALVEGHIGGGKQLPCCCWEGEIDVDLERDPDNPPNMRIAHHRAARNEADDTESSQSNDDDSDGGETNNQKKSRITNSSQTHKFWRQAPKSCKTTWSILSKEYRNGRPVTRIELRPWTGRTHQLRVHTSQVLGASIVGDDIYGWESGRRNDEMGAQGDDSPTDQLCLHARRLCIFHPISGAAMIFEADPPF